MAAHYIPTDTETTDVRVENHGSLYVFYLYGDAARAWVAENVEIPEHLRIGECHFAVEHRLAGDLAAGMIDAGLEVE